MLQALADLTADHFERDVDIAACGMRIRADLFVRFPDERGELGLCDALVLDAHLHREAETASFARTYRHGAGHLCPGRVLLLLLGDEIERAAEAGRVAGGEQVLGRCRSGLAWPAHFLRYRKVGLYQTVA